MTKSKAAATITAWLSLGITVSVSVVACANYNTAVDVKNAEIRQIQWEGQRADCNAHNGILVQNWSRYWECKGAK